MPDNLLEPITGLSIANLEKATATVNDVVSGKTFYAGDKTLKTGVKSVGWYKVGSDIAVNGTYVSVKVDISKKNIDYSSITNSNIIVVPKSSLGGNYGEIDSLPVQAYAPNIVANYNPDTGIITLTGNSICLRKHNGALFYNGTTRVDIYVIFGECVTV